MKASDVSLSTFTRARVLEIVILHRFISLSRIPKRFIAYRSSDLSMLSYACLKSMVVCCCFKFSCLFQDLSQCEYLIGGRSVGHETTLVSTDVFGHMWLESFTKYFREDFVGGI